jgi:hypothetical protein
MDLFFNMYPALTIINDFLPKGRFMQIRHEVREMGFSTEYIQEQPGTDAPKVAYENVNVHLKYPDFAIGLQNVFGAVLDIELEAFRHGFKGSQLHNKVHSDHCCSSLAAVMYFNDIEDCEGGTAFWRHKKHHWEFQPTQEELDSVGYTLGELAEDWHNEEAWDMVSLAGMRPNRIIVYPSQAFHSRFPFEGVGDKENGRLIYCAFFNL